MSESTLHILCLGYPKSGNVWLHYLMRSLLEASGHPCNQAILNHPISEMLEGEDLGIRGANRADYLNIEPLVSYWQVTSCFRWPIPDMRQYANSTNLALSHSEFYPECLNQYRQFNRHLWIIRDPRDICVSFSRFMFTPFNRLHQPSKYPDPDAHLAGEIQNILHSWTRHFSSWMEARKQGVDIQVIFYEKLVNEGVSELSKIAAFLGLELPAVTLNAILKEHALPAMKQRQPDHIYRGGWGNWMGTLTTGQKRLSQRLIAPTLQLLGYPINEEEASNWEPGLLKIPALATPTLPE